MDMALTGAVATLQKHRESCEHVSEAVAQGLPISESMRGGGYTEDEMAAAVEAARVIYDEVTKLIKPLRKRRDTNVKLIDGLKETLKKWGGYKSFMNWYDTIVKKYEN